MKPTKEQIKTDESVWPDGASHYIDDTFVKWIKNDEYLFDSDTEEWEREGLEVSDTLEYYTNDHRYNVIPRPARAEWVPKVGEWCEVFFAGNEWAKRFYIGLNSHGHRIFENEMGEIHNLTSMDVRPIKTEREVFVDKALHVEAEMQDGYQPSELIEALYDAFVLPLVRAPLLRVQRYKDSIK